MGQEPALIPRKTLFGNPERADVRISHDGTRISYLAPVDGVLNVWVAPVDAIEDARPVTQDTDRGIWFYVWTYNPDRILYIQDSEGDENWHVYAVDVETRETRDLTPFEGVHAMILPMSRRFPNEALVGLNVRDPRYHDIHRVDILTGEMSLVLENDIGAYGLLTDDDFRVRLATVTSECGGTSILERSDSGEWLPFMEIGLEDGMTTYPLGMDISGRTLYMADSRGRNTSALARFDFDTRKRTILASDDHADLSWDFMIHPATSHVQAVSFEYDRMRWHVVDESIASDLERIRGVDDGEFKVTSRSHDDTRWIVYFVKDDGPTTFHLYDRERDEVEYLFANRPDLERYDLRPMKSAVVRSRDGLDMVVYYTLPAQAGGEGVSEPAKPIPTVLLVHGGPQGRDSWGYDPQHQLLANRGYAVVSVNFRGSTGFGKAFVNAGDREWGGKMHDDLIDVVEWAVERGISDPDRIAIMGGSYGGYATLVGLTFTPDVFACGVDIVGPSNLVTTLETIPPYWEPMAEMEKARVGDISTEDGRQFLESRSPLSRVDSIVRPLLIGQGANDPRVKQAESDQIVNAMKEREIPVTYVLYPDEGHGFARPENNLSFMAVAEAFLARCLGGRFEPIGDDFKDSSIKVIAGESEVPGLAAKLASSTE